MLTKATAIALLRDVGTLATEQHRAIVVTAGQVSSSITDDINELMRGNARVAGLRHVAPSSNQVVLP